MATRKALVINSGRQEQIQSGDVLDASQLDINGLSASDVALDDSIPFYDLSATSPKKMAVDRLLGYHWPAIADGRLTLESGVPVSTTDQSAKGTIYYTPFVGNRIALYDGTRWKLYAFSERSLSLSLSSSDTKDVFLYDNSGTLTLELSAAWSSPSARTDALTTQDGVYVKSGATTRRWLGTIRAGGTNTTDDSTYLRYIWNAQNRVRGRLKKFESTDSWTYSTASWRQMNNSNGNSVFVVCGMPGWSLLDLTCHSCVSSTNGSAVYASISEDSATTPATDATPKYCYCNGFAVHTEPKLIIYPGLGSHYYSALERGGGSGTQTWYGDAGDNTLIKSGLTGWWEY